MSDLPATREYEGVARGNDICKFCGHEFGVSLIDRPDFCPECGERGNLVTEWDQSKVLVAADAMRDELLARIAELEAEVEGAGFENRRLLTRFHRAEAALAEMTTERNAYAEAASAAHTLRAALAERDRILGLAVTLVDTFERMWADVDEDHCGHVLAAEHDAALDAWYARVEDA